MQIYAMVCSDLVSPAEAHADPVAGTPEVSEGGASTLREERPEEAASPSESVVKAAARGVEGAEKEAAGAASASLKEQDLRGNAKTEDGASSGAPFPAAPPKASSLPPSSSSQGVASSQPSAPDAAKRGEGGVESTATLLPSEESDSRKREGVAVAKEEPEEGKDAAVGANANSAPPASPTPAEPLPPHQQQQPHHQHKQQQQPQAAAVESRGMHEGEASGTSPSNNRRRTRTASPRRCLLWQALAKKVERIKGVCYSSTRHEWIAVGPVQLGSGRKKNIYFSVTKFGFGDARQLAIECRRRQEQAVELGGGAPDATAIAAELTAELQARRKLGGSGGDAEAKAPFEEDSELLLQSLTPADLAAEGASLPDSADELSPVHGGVAAGETPILRRSRRDSVGLLLGGEAKAGALAADAEEAVVGVAAQEGEGGGRPYELRKKRRTPSFMEDRDDGRDSPVKTASQQTRRQRIHRLERLRQQQPTAKASGARGQQQVSLFHSQPPAALLEQPQELASSSALYAASPLEGRVLAAATRTPVKRRGRPRLREAEAEAAAAHFLPDPQATQATQPAEALASPVAADTAVVWKEEEERLLRERQAMQQQRANMALLVEALGVVLEDLGSLCGDGERLLAAGFPAEAVRICSASCAFIEASRRRVAAATQPSQLEDYVRLFRECIVSHTLPSRKGPEQILRFIEGLARKEKTFVSAGGALLRGSSVVSPSPQQPPQSLLQAQIQQQQQPHSLAPLPPQRPQPQQQALSQQQQQQQQLVLQQQLRHQQQQQRLLEQQLREAVVKGEAFSHLKTTTAFSETTSPGGLQRRVVSSSGPLDDAPSPPLSSANASLQPSQLAGVALSAAAAAKTAQFARSSFPPRDSVLRKCKTPSTQKQRQISAAAAAAYSERGGVVVAALRCRRHF